MGWIGIGLLKTVAVWKIPDSHNMVLYERRWQEGETKKEMPGEKEEGLEEGRRIMEMRQGGKQSREEKRKHK